MPIREDAYFAPNGTPSRVAKPLIFSSSKVAGNLSRSGAPDAVFTVLDRAGTNLLPVSPGKGKVLNPMTFFVDPGNTVLEDIVTVTPTPFSITTPLLTHVLGRRNEILAATEKRVVLSTALSKSPPNDIENTEVTLLVNPQDMNLSLQKLFDEHYTRGGWNIAHTSTPHPILRFQGKTAGFYTANTKAKTVGLNRSFRTNSVAYSNLMDLLALYKNNGREWDPDSNVANSGRNARRVLDIVISYDNWIFIGSFRSFEIEEDSGMPFYLMYSFQFEVRQLFHLTWAGDAGPVNRLRGTDTDNRAFTPDTLLEVSRANRRQAVVTRTTGAEGIISSLDSTFDRLNTIAAGPGTSLRQAAIAERERINGVYYNHGIEEAERQAFLLNQRIQQVGPAAALLPSSP